MKRFALLSLILLTACQEAPSGFVAAPLQFQQAPPIRLQSTEIRVVDGLKPFTAQQNVTYDFPIRPEEALQAWIKDRLQASGNSGTFEITLDEAVATSTPLNKTEGFAGIVKNEPSERIELTLKATMRYYSGTRGLSDASSYIFVTQTATISELDTFSQRQAIYDRMLREAMGRFNSEAESRLRQYFSRFIR